MNSHDSDYEITTSGKKFVLLYQLMSLIDGVFALWTADPPALVSNTAFCREVLSMEPDVAAALLALLTRKEGGINQDKNLTNTKSKYNNYMAFRIVKPLATQIAEDYGGLTDDEHECTSTDLLRVQLEFALSGFFGLARGRKIDYTRFLNEVGITDNAAVVCGKKMAPIQFYACVLTGDNLSGPLGVQSNLDQSLNPEPCLCRTPGIISESNNLYTISSAKLMIVFLDRAAHERCNR